MARLDAAAQLARSTLPPQAVARTALIAGLGYAHFIAGHDTQAIAAMNEALPLLVESNSPGVGNTELMLGRAPNCGRTVLKRRRL